MTSSDAPSLLWPPVTPHSSTSLISETVAADLNLHAVATALVPPDTPAARRPTYERVALDVLRHLLADAEVIRYRQAVLADLVDAPDVRRQLTELLPALEALSVTPRGERYRPSATADASLEPVARRLADLELLVDVVVRLHTILASRTPTSEGLRNLAAAVQQLRTSDTFAALERELPELRGTLSSVRSVTIGINLGPDLQPRSATILGFSSDPIEGRRTLLGRLLGEPPDGRGISPLQRGDGGPQPRSNALLRDLQQLLGRVVGPLRTALERYDRVSTAPFSGLAVELAFMLGAASLADRLRDAGLPTSRPECLAPDERTAALDAAYDLSLALARDGPSPVVANTVRFSPTQGRVWVLTGPNHGGKTTYTRTVGVAQVLFQAGLFVPASAARLSPVDAIHTHFPAREEAVPGEGRLDTEAKRLATIFNTATPHSLILLNEALAGTSALEALDLARGVVRALRMLGARAMYVTHLHELAFVVDEINASTPGDAIVGSLVAVAGDAGSPRTRTYRVEPGLPTGTSFAAEIAERHGISYEQLARLLRDRLLAGDPPTRELPD